MTLRLLPNLITVLRILLVAPVVFALLDGRFTLALWLFAIAGASDGIDGYLARRFGWESWLGSILDPIADKLLQVSVYMVLGWLGHLPWWLVIEVIARDVVIVSGSLTYYAIFHHFDADPSLVSKLNTALQILLVLLVIVHVSMVTLPWLLLQGLMMTMFVTTVISGTDYVMRWIRLAMENKGRQ